MRFRFWSRKRRRRFAVLLHAKNLLMTDDRDVECVGGAYTWSDVEGTDENAAVQQAIHELVTAEAFVREVRNQGDRNIRIEAEEIISLDGDEKNRSTGIVFYVATDEES